MLYGVQEVNVHAGTAKDAPPEKPRNYLGNYLRYFRMGLCEIEVKRFKLLKGESRTIAAIAVGSFDV